MKTRSWVLLILSVVSAGQLLVDTAHAQLAEPRRPMDPGKFTCSPAPCVLPPTQASEGGSIVTDAPIATDPLNPKRLLLGSVDANCNPPGLGFHLSSDGGSTWKVTCMAAIVTRQGLFEPADEPSVGYDRKGAAYIAGLYFDGEGQDHGLVAVQKSADGTHWNNPVVALRDSGQTFPFETGFAVDTNAGSPRVNSLYVSGVLWSDRGYDNQVLVSHSTDGGITWKQVAADSVRKYPAIDRSTRIAVGKDGTVYLTWMRCVGTNTEICGENVAHMMFSKSTDGGNKWSPPQRMTTVTVNGALPNTGQRVYNYPVIGVDNSSGPYAGNLYVTMYTWTGTHLRVQVIRSSDGGTTWSKPVHLAPSSDTHDQFFPALSVSDTGLVGVSWLDRRNDPNNIDYQAFAAISTDGGQTFPNQRLTKAFSDPNNNGTGNNWMGDYTGNTWAGNDFIAAWMDSSNGVDMQEVVGGIRLK
jgi:hypothetical protein